MKERTLILLTSYINTTSLFEGILSFLLQGVPLKYFPRFFHQNPIPMDPTAHSVHCTWQQNISCWIPQNCSLVQQVFFCWKISPFCDSQTQAAHGSSYCKSHMKGELLLLCLSLTPMEILEVKILLLCHQNYNPRSIQYPLALHKR